MQPTDTETQSEQAPATAPDVTPDTRQMPCPQCGYPMPDLRGGKGSVCANCGYKDSCCF